MYVHMYTLFRPLSSPGGSASVQQIGGGLVVVYITWRGVEALSKSLHALCCMHAETSNASCAATVCIQGL